MDPIIPLLLCILLIVTLAIYWTVWKIRAELNQKPFAMFTLCMTLAMRDGEKYRSQVSEWLRPIRSLVQPVSEGLFAGVLDIQIIPSLRDRLKFRLSVLFRV